MDCDEGAVSSSTPSVPPRSSSAATASAVAASVEEKQVTSGGLAVAGATETAASAAATSSALSLQSVASAPKARKSWKRKNAWGNRSYADLIYRAIDSSPEKRLTLAQIYDWLIQNIDYFRQNSDNKSSIGWKNSIRHNLSLHSRFIRIQNDGAGKSSWWTIGPSTPAAHKNLRRKADSNSFPGTGNSPRAKVECMRMQPQSRTDSQWNTQERLRYYHLTSNPVNTSMVEGGPTALRSAVSPDRSEQGQMMLAAHNALRGYTYLDWKSGLTSTEPNDWWYPMEYKRCLTEWTSSHGYFLGGGEGGRGGGEWGSVEEGYHQKCLEFVPTDEGRMSSSSSFGRQQHPPLKCFKGGEDLACPYEARPRPPPLPLGLPPSASSVVPVDSHPSYTTSFDNNSYSSIPYTPHSAAAQCLNQPDVIHPTSTLPSPANPMPPPPYVAPFYNNALFTQTEGQPCVVSVSCCSALSPSSLLSASAGRATLDRRNFGCHQSQALPVHGWTVSHSLQQQQQQQQQQQSQRLSYCYQDLMPNRLEIPSYHLLPQPSFPIDPYPMQYCSYSGCDGTTDSSEELQVSPSPPPPPPPLCSSIENRLPDGAAENHELKVFDMRLYDPKLCEIEDCDVAGDILIRSGGGRGGANGGSRSGADGAAGVSFELPFGPIVSQLNPTT